MISYILSDYEDEDEACKKIVDKQIIKDEQDSSENKLQSMEKYIKIDQQGVRKSAQHANIESEFFSKALGYILYHASLIAVSLLIVLVMKAYLQIQQNARNSSNFEKSSQENRMDVPTDRMQQIPHWRNEIEKFKQKSSEKAEMKDVDKDTSRDISFRIKKLEKQQEEILSTVVTLSEAMGEYLKRQSSDASLIGSTDTSLFSYLEAVEKWKRKIEALKSDLRILRLRLNYRDKIPDLDFKNLKYVNTSRDNLTSTQLKVIASYMETYQQLKGKRDYQEQYYMEGLFAMFKYGASSIWSLFVGEHNESFVNITISRNSSSDENDDKLMILSL